MSVGVCGIPGYGYLWSLIEGPITDVDLLIQAEHVVRLVLLHDTTVLLPDVLPSDTNFKVPIPAGPEQNARSTGITSESVPSIVIAMKWKFFEYDLLFPLPEIQLAPTMYDLAAKYAKAGEGDRHYEAHLRYLKRVLGTVYKGGSALFLSPFGEEAIQTTSRYPAALFEQLDIEWQNYAGEVHEHGIPFSVPPILGVVLTRSARRDAIPAVIEDLRNEWADARQKVWRLLDSLRTTAKLSEALDIEAELVEASKLFSLKQTELDIRPVRVLWEIVAAAVAGAGVATISAGKPIAGAVVGAISQAARNLPGLAHEFGPSLFGRGAFDLARHVRRSVSTIEADALPRLLTEAEKTTLGFR